MPDSAVIHPTALYGLSLQCEEMKRGLETLWCGIHGWKMMTFQN
jgi:hypothetical protein